MVSSYSIWNTVVSASVYIVPIAVLGMFVFSLVRYLRGKKQCRRDPDSISPEALRGRMILFIVFAVILGVMITVIAALAALLMSAIAYM